MALSFLYKGLSGDEFHFDPNGDGPARYNIIHFKQVAPNDYKWVRVGQYLEGELKLNISGMYTNGFPVMRITFFYYYSTFLLSFF